MLEAMRDSIARFISPRDKRHDDVPLSAEVNALASALMIGTQPPRRGAAEMLAQYNRLPQMVQVFGKIAQSVAQLQWQTFVALDASGQKVRSKKLERAYEHDARERLIKRGLSTDGLEEIDNDPLIDFLEEGNLLLTGFECREVMQLHLDLVGECFAWIERGPDGVPIRYWPLPPTWITDTPQLAGGSFKVQVRSATIKVEPSDMFHIKITDPFKPYGRGVGIGTSLGDELDTDEYAARWLKMFFFNNATPSLLISVPGLGADELKRYENDWNNKNRGAGRGHRTHMLNKEAKATKLGADMKSIPMVALRTAMRDIVRETPGVPPEIVGKIDSSNRATIEAATFIFARWVIVPRADRWRMAIQNQIVPLFDRANTNSRRLRIVGFVSPVPADRQFQLDVAKTAPHTRTRGEWREMQGLDPNEDVDNVYMQAATLIERPADDPNWQPPAVATPPTPTRAMVIDSKFIEHSPHLQLKAPPPLQPSDIESLVDRVDPDLLTTRLEPFWSDELKSWGDRILGELGVQASFNMLNPIVIQHLDTFALRNTNQINETTRERVRRALVDGMQAGEDHRRISKRITEVFTEARGWRAVTIARTEAAISANFATWQAQKQSGVVDKRQWITTLDGRARETSKANHVVMHGVIVGIDQPFELPGGIQTMAPGQSGVAAHDINERCTTIAVFDEEEMSASAITAVWKAFDTDVMGWERRTEAEYRKAFTEQFEELLEAFDELARGNGAL